MSPFEIYILRFVFTLDNVLVALMPWLKALADTAVMMLIALLTRRITRRKASSVR